MNGLNIQIKEVVKTQHIDIQKATVTKDGKIQLPDGRIFSVNLSKNGESVTHLTADQLQTLASKALKILQNTGEKFQTLDQLSIKKHSVTHLVGGKTQEYSGAGTNKGKWKQTATKIIDQFSKPIDQKDKQSSPFLNTNKNGSGNVQFQIKEKQNNTPSVRPRSLELESPNKSKSRRRLSDVFSEIKTEKQETKPILNTQIEIPKNDKEVQREAVSNVISQTLPNEGPKEVAGKLVNVLANKNPTIKEKVETFKNLHKEKIKVLNEKGWIGLKNDLKSKKQESMMTDKGQDPDQQGMSYEEFRQATNKLVVELVNLASSEMGIDPIKAGSAGTPGYNSDVDLNMKSEKPPGLPTGDMVIVRSVANLLSTEILGGMPGLAIDTEWYVDRKFLGDQVTTDTAKSQIATLDLAMGIVQAREGFNGHPEQFKAFAEKQIEGSHGEVKEIKKQLFEQAEGLYNKMESEIEEEFQKQNGKSVEEMKNDPSFKTKYYNAKVLSQYRNQLELGKKCADLERQIQEGKGKMNPEQLDKLIVQHDIIYALINCTQPEGTMSSSELQTTLDSKIGQIVQRNKENKVKELNKQLKSLENQPASKSNSEKMMNILKQIEKTKLSGKEYTIPQLMLAGQERLAQFSHKIQENYDPIDAGKYCLRVAESNYYALKMLGEEQKDNLPKGFNELLKQAEENFQKAKDLEQPKRGFFLNTPTAKKILIDVLGNKNNNQKLSNDLDNLLKREESQITENSGIMLKSEKMKVMLHSLKNNGHLSQQECEWLEKKPKKGELMQKPNTMDENRFNQLMTVKQVLQARAGYKTEKEKYAHLKKLHGNSKTETLEKYNLKEKKDVKAFGKEVEAFSLQVQNFMFNHGAMPKFDQTFAQENNFAEIWSGTKI